MPDSSWKLIVIPIPLWQLERDTGSPTSPREASLLPCQSSSRIPSCPLQLDRSPDVAEQTGVLKGYPHPNLRLYPRFQPQLEKNHETSPSPQEEAWIPCIACRAILYSPSNTKEALTSLMELQRVTKITVTNLEGPWGHCSNMKSSKYHKSSWDESWLLGFS